MCVICVSMSQVQGLNNQWVRVIVLLLFTLVTVISQSLATEKERIVSMLKRQESVTEQLSQEKQQTEDEMRTKLEQIEEKTQNLLAEKAEAEMRYTSSKFA